MTVVKHHRGSKEMKMTLQDHLLTSFKTIPNNAKNEDSFQDHCQKYMQVKSLLSRLFIKVVQKNQNWLPSRPLPQKVRKLVNSRPSVRISLVLSWSWQWSPKVGFLHDHLKEAPKDQSSIHGTCSWGGWLESFQIPRQQSKSQPRKEQPPSGKPVTGSSFNHICMKSGTTWIDNTADLQGLYPNSIDCISDMGWKYDIKVNPAVPPVQHRRWKVPIRYKKDIKKELNEMVWQWFITQQMEPTLWVSSLT